MKKSIKVLEEVEKTLKSRDTVSKLEVNPFLFTRIKSRIENESVSYAGKSKLDFVLKPSILVLILLLNIITMVYFLGVGSSQVSENSIVDTMKEEYGNIQIQIDNYNLE